MAKGMSNTGDFTHKHGPKRCVVCGETFWKRSTLSLKQWEKKRFCSNACLGISRRSGHVTKDGRIKVWSNGVLRWRYHVVAEEQLGRALEPGEVVDHINGDHTDDRPENLRVFASHREHMANHWREGTIVRIPGSRGTTVAVRQESEWP